VASLPYPHWEETANPAYQVFLGQRSMALPARDALVST
jgi:hypothetical protein